MLIEMWGTDAYKPGDVGHRPALARPVVGSCTWRAARPDVAGQPQPHVSARDNQQGVRVMITQPAVPDHIEYLSMREAADRYHVSVITLRRRIRTGTLPAVHC